MHTKIAITLIFLATSFSQVFSVGTPVTEKKITPHLNESNPIFPDMTVDEFLNMRPRHYRKMTGKRLGFKKSIQLKLAQRFLKKQKRNKVDISKTAYIIMALFGLGWLAMGLMDDWEGSNWLVNLGLVLLSAIIGGILIGPFLFSLAGFIHALIKKNDYY